jgi:hypothetical protein
MDKPTKKLLRQLKGVYISSVSVAKFANGKYLILNVVDKKQRLQSVSFSLRAPALMVASNLPPIDEVLDIVDMKGFMGLKIAGTFVDGNSVLICTDHDCLEVNLSNKKCDVRTRDECRNRVMNSATFGEGFDD